MVAEDLFGGRQWLDGEMVLIAGTFPKPPHPDISERLARDEPAKISPQRRPAVRAGVVVLVEFHPDIVQARDQHAGGAFNAGSGKACRC